MGRIRVLSDQVANKIAAGEVVERPSSVVKELLENSLDAGATDLRIEVGKRRPAPATPRRRRLRHAARRRHARLRAPRHIEALSADDLNAIATLGFRGEALPSIASVSRLVLETRAADEATGTRVEMAGGKLLDCDRTGSSPAAPPSPSATSSTTCPRGRSSCAASRPNWRTSPRWSRTTAWRIRDKSFTLTHRRQGTPSRDPRR